MKNIRTTVKLLPLALLFAIPAHSAFAVPPNSLPFLASFQATETYTIDGPVITSEGSGTGNATHLGRFSVECVATSTNLIGVAQFTFTAANGDTLTAETSGP